MNRCKPYIDENGCLHLFSLCDGTLIFLQQLVVSLERLGCQDIKHSQKILTDGIPEERPWMTCLFEASGKLPSRLWPGAKIIEMPGGKFGMIGPEGPLQESHRINRYQDSAFYKWLQETYLGHLTEDIKKELEEVNTDESDHDTTAMGLPDCLFGCERETAQERRNPKLENDVSGPIGDSRW